MQVGTLISTDVSFNVRHCDECGVFFALPASYVAARRKDHATFYCPNGHSRYFPSKTDEEILKEKLAQTQNQLTQATTSKIQLENQLDKANKKLKKVAEGQCPCCDKTYKHLANHMANKHPEFKK